MPFWKYCITNICLHVVKEQSLREQHSPIFKDQEVYFLQANSRLKFAKGKPESYF